MDDFIELLKTHVTLSNLHGFAELRWESCSSSKMLSKTHWLFKNWYKFDWDMTISKFYWIYPLAWRVDMVSHFHQFGKNFQIVISQSNFHQFWKSQWVLESIFPELQDPHLIFSNPWIFHRDKKGFCKIISKSQKNSNISLAIFKAS